METIPTHVTDEKQQATVRQLNQDTPNSNHQQSTEKPAHNSPVTQRFITINPENMAHHLSPTRGDQLPHLSAAPIWLTHTVKTSNILSPIHPICQSYLRTARLILTTIGKCRPKQTVIISTTQNSIQATKTSATVAADDLRVKHEFQAPRLVFKAVVQADQLGQIIHWPPDTLYDQPVPTFRTSYVTMSQPCWKAITTTSTCRNPENRRMPSPPFNGTRVPNTRVFTPSSRFKKYSVY